MEVEAFLHGQTTPYRVSHRSDSYLVYRRSSPYHGLKTQGPKTYSMLSGRKCNPTLIYVLPLLPLSKVAIVVLIQVYL